MSFLLNQTRKPNADTIAELEQTIKEIDEYKDLESIEILIFRTTLANALDFSLNRHEQIINRCYEKVIFLKELKVERYTQFYSQVAPSLICLGQYNKANDAISKSLSGISKNSLSWTVSIYYRFVIEAHQKNYKKALSIFIEAEQKEHISETMRQTWYIIRGFVKFLNLANKVDYPKPFRLENFLQNVGVFKSDKLGQNTNVLILKILHNNANGAPVEIPVAASSGAITAEATITPDPVLPGDPDHSYFMPVLVTVSVDGYQCSASEFLNINIYKLWMNYVRDADTDKNWKVR